MPRKPVIDHEEKESLVPSISREEDRLQTYLDSARAEARKIIRDAENEAAERERRAREELPALTEKRRAELLTASRSRSEGLRAELSAETEEILTKARDNCPKAVDLVVSAVWPQETR
ncbi:MAG TPA: V-type ATPase subunit subunit G family protein [Spirochaetia bacterium]|nr:V-type ATPase subunit subunit G family protein [Spirochaetia bacterium]